MKLSINQQAFITGKIYKLIKVFAKPFIEVKFHPLVFNKPEEIVEGPIVIAPNHRSTLDPFFISIYSKRPIHWVALKRFFTGEDSIFNNSKNPILCESTILLFKGIGSIPVTRSRDVDFSNPEMVKQYWLDEKQTIKMVQEYLKQGECIGIFPEETTNKHPNECELQVAKTGFVHFAKRNDATIQPVSITWIPKELNVKNRVIINYRPLFKVDDKESAITTWNEAILAGLAENNRAIASLKEGIKPKVLKLKKHW